EGGLHLTYPHQAANRPPLLGERWRQGDVCVQTPARGFGRFVLDTEPHAAPTRLWWHVARTRSWVEAARRGELLREGEPFELPVYAIASEPLVVFDQISTSLTAWSGIDLRFGYVALAEPHDNTRLRVVLSFSSPGQRGGDVLATQWGAHFEHLRDAGAIRQGVWIRCDELPTLPPWRAPETWGEFTTALAATGIDLMEILRQLSPDLRDGKGHLLLIGAPVPVRVGEAVKQIQWVALRLPVLSTRNQPRKGFRPGEEGAWRRDQEVVLAPARSLSWVPTGNWASEEISTRGRAAPLLRNARIVQIGAGALGSMLAELLVREGVTALTVMDGDTLTAGNLVRHTLSVADVGVRKATALAQHLNLANPHAQVAGIAEEFPGEARGQAALAEAEIVIDTTGSDALLQQLRLHGWGNEKLFVSISVGFFARRLFYFSAREVNFPLKEFAAFVDPWLLYEREELGDAEMPWEGTGCWHPVFPARASDFAMFAGVALRQLEAALTMPAGEHIFHVTERVEDSSGAIQLRRATLPNPEPDV
ncbi:MAG TPA: ThiF family adenylyltransferase, partial [Longimicrobium sp.]|nr:ThiF family adenylyltransferase [Longimicrobium sp.]